MAIEFTLGDIANTSLATFVAGFYIIKLEPILKQLNATNSRILEHIRKKN